MKKQKSIGAPALSTAAASQRRPAAASNAQELYERGRRIISEIGANSQTKVAPSHLPAVTHPIEMDLADPDEQHHAGNSGTEVFLDLEELYPSDEHQISGLQLRITDSGRQTILNAEARVLQRDGSQNSHYYGYLAGSELAPMCQTLMTPFFVRLREPYSKERPAPYSGATLTLFSGDDIELRACFGIHCLGVLKGTPLLKFLFCLRQRYEMEGS